ncbi:MAG: 4-hydroxy-3-methylbut-2-enyl diphosphate reductase [Chitinivibrionales bacterium]|nr:4-hydroxy-3-methylbut-2-enyl diphosphate reductase [Chitinivibrionales bacterium]
MGVQRAVTLAIETSAKGVKNIYTVGPLIHNNQTLDILKDRGIQILDEEKATPADATIIIRAHGVPPYEYEKFEKKCGHIIDGTCPKVKTVHKVITKYRSNGYAIIIVGDEGHAEVVGSQGYAGCAGYLIQSPAAVDCLPEMKKICIVSQTTFNRETFDEIAEKIRSRFTQSEIVVKKTICAATDKRQEETRQLASRVDAMIVVGGKNSANTMRLVEISRPITKTLFIETEQELSWEQISECKKIGITAGASTPTWMIRRIIDHIQSLESSHSKSSMNDVKRFFEMLANLNLFLALGGVAMYYVSSVLQSLPMTAAGAILTFLYLISIYLWNPLQNLEKNKHLDISRYRFYNAHKKVLTAVVSICLTILLTVSILQGGVALFTIMVIPTLAGIIYQLTIVPPMVRTFIPYSTLKDIPTSRDFFSALAWAVITTFIPQGIYGLFEIRPATVAVFLWTFYLAYLRSLIFDLRDIESDRIMGRETLITIIGEKRAHQFINLSLMIALVVLIALSTNFAIPQFKFKATYIYAFLSQIPVLLYILIFMKVQRILTHRLPALFNLMADGQFYVAGFCAWLISIKI